MTTSDLAHFVDNHLAWRARRPDYLVSASVGNSLPAQFWHLTIRYRCCQCANEGNATSKHAQSVLLGGMFQAIDFTRPVSEGDMRPLACHEHGKLSE
jgi:hypothetical protein